MMRSTEKTLAAGCAGFVVCASMALAVDLPEPTFTYCEIEIASPFRAPIPINDTFSQAEVVNAPSEFADCFYITGKLQKDCIWDRQPKCCLVEFSKPLTAFDETGRNIGLVEEVLSTSIPLSDEPAQIDFFVLDDGTIRIGVTSVFDCFDGTLNGLFSNGLHGTTGEVTLVLSFDGQDLARGEAPGPGSFEEYTFRFEEGREALRLAYVVTPDTEDVLVSCYDDRGTKEICYDVDFYWVNGLTPREVYCITQIGGKDNDCDATDTALGWFDKNGQRQGGSVGFNSGESGSSNVLHYSEICVLADEMGAIRFAVTGIGDSDFNGLQDFAQDDYFEFLEDEGYIPDTNNVIKGEGWVPGASTKTNPDDVIRLSRTDFDDYPEYACPPGHGVCGCYTFKVRLNVHEDEGVPMASGQKIAQRADMSGDGFVDAIDLAMLLSFWGPVQ